MLPPRRHERGSFLQQGRPLGHLHLPHAPRGRAAGARLLPQVRHGPRTHPRHRRERRAGRPGAQGHDPAVLARRGADRARADPRNGAHGRPARRRMDRTPAREVARARFRHPRRALRRLAAAGQRRPLRRVGEPQHVHADRRRRDCGVDLQPDRHRPAGRLPRLLPQRGGRGRGVLRGRRGHRHAGPARTGARRPGPRPHRRRDPQPDQPRRRHRPPHRRPGQRRRGPARRGRNRRQAPGPARREGARRRRAGGGLDPDRRVHAHGRADARGEIARRQGHRRRR